jgi:hypothetical protein
MEQIDAWLDALLVLHFRINQTERQYVSAFKATVGRSSPIYTMLESPDPDGEFVGTFMEEILRRADHATAQFRIHARIDHTADQMALACKKFYPAFSPPAQLVRAIATAELEATRPHARVERAREAEQELKLLERQLQEAQYEHATRDGLEQFTYISEHPNSNSMFPRSTVWWPTTGRRIVNNGCDMGTSGTPTLESNSTTTWKILSPSHGPATKSCSV